MCAIAACLLYRKIDDAGVQTSLVVKPYWKNQEHRHCFVLAEDHIVDITANRFGKNDVEIVSCSQAKLPWFLAQMAAVFYHRIHDSAPQTHQMASGPDAMDPRWFHCWPCGESVVTRN